MITRVEFDKDLLRRLGYPVKADNLRALVAWCQTEGDAARFNPYGTTKRMPGSDSFNSVGVQNYVSLEQGLEATKETLRESQPGYGHIRYNLMHNMADVRTCIAIGDSNWGTDGELLLRVLGDCHHGFYREYADHPIVQ